MEAFIIDPQMERSGTYRKNKSVGLAYESFIPTPLQQVELRLNDEVNRLVDRIHQQLETYQPLPSLFEQEIRASTALAYGSNIFNDNLVPQWTETALSSEEETDCLNLKKATLYAFEAMDKLPLSSRLFTNAHYLLMQGKHHEGAYAGEYRKSPVWMGAPEATLADAIYIAPVYEDMIEAISDLENYINYEESTDPFIMAALIHYQFETIHPFIDGNGRIGRLITQLFLKEKKVMTEPALPLSTYLLKEQARYYTGISSVQLSGTYEKWITFFLKAISASMVAESG